MFSRGTSQHRFATFAAALLMSLVAIGAAAGPGTSVAARPFAVAAYA